MRRRGFPPGPRDRLPRLTGPQRGTIWFSRLAAGGGAAGLQCCTEQALDLLLLLCSRRWMPIGAESESACGCVAEVEVAGATSGLRLPHATPAPIATVASIPLAQTVRPDKRTCAAGELPPRLRPRFWRFKGPPSGAAYVPQRHAALAAEWRISDCRRRRRRRRRLTFARCLRPLLPQRLPSAIAGPPTMAAPLRDSITVLEAVINLLADCVEIGEAALSRVADALAAGVKTLKDVDYSEEEDAAARRLVWHGWVDKGQRRRWLAPTLVCRIPAVPAAAAGSSAAQLPGWPLCRTPCGSGCPLARARPLRVWADGSCSMRVM